jgi:hypothetical protein
LATTNTHELYFNGANATSIYAQGGDMYLLAGSGKTLNLGSNDVNSQLVINAGNVGIGTTNPGAKLDISAGNLDLDTTTNTNQFGVTSRQRPDNSARQRYRQLSRKPRIQC